jgi:hypothetical protein
MGAVYAGSVIAHGKAGNTLTNFTDSCAASDVRVNLGMGNFHGTLQEWLQPIDTSHAYADTKESVNNQEVNLTLPQSAFLDANSSGLTPPPDSNSSDNNDSNRSFGPGSAKVWVYTTIKKPTKTQLGGQEGINPARLLYRDLNVTGDLAHSKADQTTHLPKGSQAYGTYATFMFARVTPDQLYYPDITDSYKATPLYVNVYCRDSNDTNCSNLNISSPGKGANDTPSDWHLADMFTVPADIGRTDMNISTSEGIDADPYLAAAGMDETAKAKIIHNVPFDKPNVAQQTDINVSVAGPGRPSTVKIFYNPVSPWLYYGDANQSFFRVKFIGHRNWSGIGKTGEVTNTTSSQSTRHRMNW